MGDLVEGKEELVTESFRYQRSRRSCGDVTKKLESLNRDRNNVEGF